MIDNEQGKLPSAEHTQFLPHELVLLPDDDEDEESPEDDELPESLLLSESESESLELDEVLGVSEVELFIGLSAA